MAQPGATAVTFAKATTGSTGMEDCPQCGYRRFETHTNKRTDARKATEKMWRKFGKFMKGVVFK